MSALKCRQKKKEQYERLIKEKEELYEKTKLMELQIRELTQTVENERIEKARLLQENSHLKKASMNDTHSTLESKIEEETKQALSTCSPIQTSKAPQFSCSVFKPFVNTSENVPFNSIPGNFTIQFI